MKVVLIVFVHLDMRVMDMVLLLAAKMLMSATKILIHVKKINSV